MKREFRHTDRNTRRQDWINLLLGAWLFLTPAIGIGPPTGVVAGNAYALGFLVMVFSAWALSQPGKGKEWVNVLLGLWIIVAPFTPGFAQDGAALWNALVGGTVIGAAALWAIAQPALSKPAQVE